jgi:hypothetical protein
MIVWHGVCHVASGTEGVDARVSTREVMTAVGEAGIESQVW